MAQSYAFVQQTTSAYNPASSSSLTTSLSATQGNGWIISVSYGNIGGVIGLTDVKINGSVVTTVMAINESDSQYINMLIYVPNLPSGVSSVTVDLASTPVGGWQYTCYEYSGLTPTTTGVVGSGGTGSTITATNGMKPPTVTPTPPGMIFGAMCMFVTTTTTLAAGTAPNAMTARSTATLNASMTGIAALLYAEDALTFAKTAVTPTWTASAAGSTFVNTCIFVPLAPQSPGLVQSGAINTVASGVNSPTITNVQAGDTLIAFVGGNGSSAYAAPTDTAGQTWTLYQQTQNANLGHSSAAIAVLFNAKAGTHTLSWTTMSGSSSSVISEWKGLYAVGGTGAVGSNTSAGTTMTSAAYTQSQANELLIVTGNSTGTAITDPPTGYTSLAFVTAAQTWECAFQIVSSSSSRTATYTWTTSGDGSMVLGGMKFAPQDPPQSSCAYDADGEPEFGEDSEDEGETPVFDWYADEFTPQRANVVVATSVPEQEDASWVLDDDEIDDEPFDWTQPATGPPNEAPYGSDDSDDKAVQDDDDVLPDEDAFDSQWGPVGANAVTTVAGGYDASVDDEQDEDDRLDKEAFDVDLPPVGPPNQSPYGSHDASLEPDPLEDDDEDFGAQLSTVPPDNANPAPPQLSDSDPDPLDDDDEDFSTQLSPAAPSNYGALGQYDASGEEEEPDDADEAFGFELAPLSANFVQPNLPNFETGDQSDDEGQIDDEDFAIQSGPVGAPNELPYPTTFEQEEERDDDDEAFDVQAGPVGPAFVQPNLPNEETGDQVDEEGEFLDDEPFDIQASPLAAPNEVPYGSDDAAVLAALGDDEETGEAEVSLDTQSSPLSPDNASGGMFDASQEPDHLDDEDEDFATQTPPVSADNLAGGMWDGSQEPDSLDDEDEAFDIQAGPLSADAVAFTQAPFGYDASGEPDPLDEDDEDFGHYDGQGVLGGTGGPALGVSFEDASQQEQDEDALGDEAYDISDSQVVYTNGPPPVPPVNDDFIDGKPFYPDRKKYLRQLWQDERDMEDILRMLGDAGLL